MPPEGKSSDSKGQAAEPPGPCRLRQSQQQNRNQAILRQVRPQETSPETVWEHLQGKLETPHITSILRWLKSIQEGDQRKATLGSHTLLGQDILTRGHHWHLVLCFFFFLQAKKQRQSIYRILISEIIQALRSRCWNHTQYSITGMPDKNRS